MNGAKSSESWKTLRNLLVQLIQYSFVGGIAALVEWTSYFLFDTVLHWHYLLATVLSFLIATFVNWAVGRCTMFRNAEKNGTIGEILQIYFVSGIGLLLNLVLMYVFVAMMGIPGVFAKIAATGVVFIWNFISRKVFIYH